MLDLLKCNECGHEISSNNSFFKKTGGLCPKCGAKVKTKKEIIKKYVPLIIGILFLVVFIIFYMVL